MTVEFLLTALVVVVSPGTGVLTTLAAGLSRGARAGIAAAFGCTLGIVPHMAAAVLGLAAILHASAVLFDALRLLGVAWLLFMAWTTLREDGPLAVGPAAEHRSDAAIAVRAILVNVLNPKLSIFFLAFLPQFVPSDAPAPVLAMLELGAVFMLMTFVVFAGYGLFAATVRDHLIARPRILAWLRRSFAAAFVLLGLRLAVERR